MKNNKEDNHPEILNNAANEKKRKQALRERCAEYRERLKQRNPQEIARKAAMSLQKDKDDKLILSGDHLLETYTIIWPELTITDKHGNPARLSKETLLLHYLDRADGRPLTRRWVNLSEIGGLFYQQAFQGYCGDELAAAWKDDLDGLRQKCLATGGWEMRGPGDLAFEWRVLPRLLLCLCYRLPVETNEGGIKNAWATILFDAATDHYVAADVAAIAAKELADQLKP